MKANVPGRCCRTINGTKYTAVLSLILVERNTPIIIDQPEDDLDNAFIFSKIVQTLRHEKERRQFIIATHNANIPVSGDAELIMLMKADEQHGWIECAGSIDDQAENSLVNFSFQAIIDQSYNIQQIKIRDTPTIKGYTPDYVQNYLSKTL